MRRLAAAALVLALAAPARAEDLPFDLRAPVRAGFAYTALSRGPALSLSWTLEVDLAKVAPRLAVTGVLDFDGHARLDLPDDDPRSSFSMIGAGAGLFYATEGDVAFGVATTLGPSFDAKDLTGFAFETRVYFIPYYVPMSEAVKREGDHFGAWVRSALSFWASARIDFTGDANGTTLAFGGAIDVMRIAFLPYMSALVNKLR